MHNNYPMQPPMMPEYPPMMPEHPPIMPPERPMFGHELLKNFSFELGVAPLAPGQFTSVEQPLDWTALRGSAPVEIVQSPYPFPTPSTGSVTSINGTHWIDTQATPGGINIEQTFNVPHAPFLPVTALRIQIAAAFENINGQTTNPDDLLQVTVDGRLTQEINIHNFSNGSGGVDYNQFKVFTSTLFVTPGQHTIELHDVGIRENVGIAVDFVSVKAAPPIVGIIAALLEHHFI